MRMFRLQPFSMVCCAYQMRSAKFFSLSKIVQLWNHGNCAATCCTKSSSGQASAKALIYLRFRGEKPLISGNALLRTHEARTYGTPGCVGGPAARIREGRGRTRDKVQGPCNSGQGRMPALTDGIASPAR